MEIPTDVFEQCGAYPLIFVNKKTNEVICETCARNMDLQELIDEFAYDIFYEGPDLYCDECNEIIESAYGVPDEHMDDYMSDR
ncbi:hypothetical protein KKH23_09665 [Patescibacteria group bacterium]|nr:hypothetical protein [Patescibacteria group bacterium]